MNAYTAPRIYHRPRLPASSHGQLRPAGGSARPGRPPARAGQTCGRGAHSIHARSCACCACMGVCFCRLRMAQSTLACSSRIVPNMNCATRKRLYKMQPWPPAAQGAVRKRLRSRTVHATCTQTHWDSTIPAVQQMETSERQESPGRIPFPPHIQC